MMFTRTVLSALLVAAAAAVPTGNALEARGGSGIVNPNDYCTDGLLYTSFQCCTTRVLGGVASLDCSVPHNIPKDCITPESICKATIGGKPQCCTVPVLGLALLCQDVSS